MSGQSPSQRIIAEQEELTRRYHAEREEANAKDREQARLRSAWDTVAFHVEPDGEVRTLSEDPEESLAAAVRAVALLCQLLRERDLLDKLAESPPGVEGQELSAWRVAVDILRGAADDPAEAGRLLGAIRGKLFASTVRRWLCHGFRKVVEGNWREGHPLAVQLLGSWLEPAPPRPDNGPAVGAEADRAAAEVEVANGAPPPTPPTPQWDAKTLTLYLGDKQLKKWVRRAPNQHSLLAAFQKAGWPQSIEAPLSGEQLKQALRELRKALRDTPLLFERAGQRCTVSWQVC
jgi:hypothetical protein